jgi:hypothetical protein
MGHKQSQRKPGLSRCRMRDVAEKHPGEEDLNAKALPVVVFGSIAGSGAGVPKKHRITGPDTI